MRRREPRRRGSITSRTRSEGRYRKQFSRERPERVRSPNQRERDEAGLISSSLACNVCERRCSEGDWRSQNGISLFFPKSDHLFALLQAMLSICSGTPNDVPLLETFSKNLQPMSGVWTADGQH